MNTSGISEDEKQKRIVLRKKAAINKGAKVLELGCGTGGMWKNRESLICACSKIILSDFSECTIPAFFFTPDTHFVLVLL